MDKQIYVSQQANAHGYSILLSIGKILFLKISFHGTSKF